MENKNNEELNLYEMYIFEAEKDLCRNNGELCRRYKQFKGKVDYAKIYRFIVNYRVEKYGTSFLGNNYFYRDRQECLYLKDLAKQRRKSRLGR